MSTIQSPDVSDFTELPPTLQTVRRSSLADQVEAYLRDSIIRGALPSGTRIVELDIASQLGTSQAPVREALQRLEQAGLVERHSRSATYIADISMDEMFEIATVRTTLETLAIRHTACCITPEQCDELETLVEAMREAARANDMASLSGFDMEFHRRICQWSDKNTLLRVWITLYYQQQRYLVATHPQVFPDLMEVAELHVPILEALRANNPDRAAEAIQSHIMLIWDSDRLGSSGA